MRATPPINPEYVVTLQGQRYCTYRGVLDCAHAMGLEGIRTRILQVPGPENEFVAIVEAEVRLKDGRVFTDVADASPKNVPPMLHSALIRMASTRAKGRALRDAVNIGEALVEELPDVETEPIPPLRPAGSAARASASRTAPGAATPAGAPPAPPAEPQSEPFPEAAPSPTPEHPQVSEPPPELVCSNAECGRPVTQGQYNYSVRTYGAALCPACQRRQSSQGRTG